MYATQCGSNPPEEEEQFFNMENGLYETPCGSNPPKEEELPSMETLESLKRTHVFHERRLISII